MDQVRIDPPVRPYEEPQLVDLEEEVGCGWICATGGDS